MQLIAEPEKAGGELADKEVAAREQHGIECGAPSELHVVVQPRKTRLHTTEPRQTSSFSSTQQHLPHIVLFTSCSGYFHFRCCLPHEDMFTNR